MKSLFLVALAIVVQLAHLPKAQGAHFDHPHDAVGAGGFSDSLFAFFTVINYDGISVAGGWQEAIATLKFVDARHFIPQTWTCTVKVGMPIKPGNYGVISPATAARMSAAAATTASMLVMKSRPEWIPVSYCIQFKEEMELILNTTFPKLGARIWKL